MSDKNWGAPGTSYTNSAASKAEDACPSDTSPSDEGAYSAFSDTTRTYLTYLLGFVITTSTLTATIYFPLIPMLASNFQVSIQSINLTVTSYAICQALSPMIFASLADTCGRRPILLLLLLIYSGASLGLAINKKSYGILLGMRVLQSIGGSATPPIAYGIVADIAVVAERGKMLGPLLSTCNAISAVGPVIGGAVALQTNGFIWVFLSLLIVAVICFVLVGATLPETARPVVGNGEKSARGIWRTWTSFLHLETQFWTPTATSDVPASMRKRWEVKSAFGALRIIFYPDAALVLWMNASVYSIYYTFQVAIPVIFAEVYGFNALQIGLVFLPGLAGMTLGGIAAGKLLDRNYTQVAREQGIQVREGEKPVTDLATFPIEMARYRNVLPLIAIEAALVAGYGWTIEKHVHPAVPIVLQFFICALATMLSHIASALLVDIFPDMPSTAYASGQAVRCGLSAASTSVIDPLVRAVGQGWYFVIFSLFTTLGGMLCVLGSRWRGMHWRKRRTRVN